MSDTSNYEAGSWQATLDKSATLFERSGKARQQASRLLWEGAQAATEDWITSSDEDVNAEGLYNSVLDILGKPRKGDASKIKTVALAVRNNGLVMGAYDNLSKAYAEARRLTQTVKVHAAEDAAAEEAVAEIATSAPKSSSTPEGAAMIVLSKGVDEAARLLLDALGATNTAAHRSLLRAISQEIAGRVQPAPKPKKASTPKPKAAKKATAKPGDGSKKAKPAASGTAKPKPAAKKAAPKAKPKPAPVEVEAEVEEPTVGDMFSDIVGDEAEVEETTTTTTTAKPKPAGGRRGPVRRR